MATSDLPNDLYEKGMAMRTELLGEDFVQQMNKSTYEDPVMQKFRTVVAENVFGALWSRPGLDLKTRTLICIIADTAQGCEAELAFHLRMARRQGWTEDELTEALIHLTGYLGILPVRGAMLTASRVFREMREEGGDGEGAG